MPGAFEPIRRLWAMQTFGIPTLLPRGEKDVYKNAEIIGPQQKSGAPSIGIGRALLSTYFVRSSVLRE